METESSPLSSSFGQACRDLKLWFPFNFSIQNVHNITNSEEREALEGLVRSYKYHLGVSRYDSNKFQSIYNTLTNDLRKHNLWKAEGGFQAEQEYLTETFISLKHIYKQKFKYRNIVELRNHITVAELNHLVALTHSTKSDNTEEVKSFCARIKLINENVDMFI